MHAQSGDGHDPNLILSYTPSGYSTPVTMRQDDGYANFSKNSINNNGGNTELFVNFTYDTTGDNVYVVYTTDGSVPTKTNGTSVSGSFSNFSNPNRTWSVEIPNTANVAGTTIEYVFYISNSDLASGYGRITTNGLQFTWTEGDTRGYTYKVNDSNVSSGGDWSQTTTWNSGTVPNTATNSVEIIGSNTVNLDQTYTIENLTVLSGASLDLNSGNGLTVSGDLSNSGTVTANSGSSLIVNGTSTGNINYNLTVNDTDFHLLSSPVEGEGYDPTWVTANLIDVTNGQGNNIGIASYVNTSDADGDFVWVQSGTSGSFNTGQGYSMKREATTSDMTFTGTLKTNDAAIAITANDIGGANENRWTLIGNPFSSFIDIDALLTNAGNQTALEDAREAVYVWNGSSYLALTTGYIHPGQGFFVNSNTASESITITQGMLSHQTGVNFYRNSNTKIDLTVSNGNTTRSTEINYIQDKTTGLDPRFDIGTFTGSSSTGNTSFNLYTRLADNSSSTNFMRQALPNQNFESMVIPVGINAVSGSEITFTADAMNLPSGINVYLEDKVTGDVTRLDEANSSYKVTLSENLNGIGRFYLHTKTSSVLSTDNINLDNVSVYTTNKNNLRIVGVNNGQATVELFNILGKQVLSKTFTANGVEDTTLPNLATGIYLVQLQTESGKISKKIILE